MKELKRRYQEAKLRAIDLMENGRISEYISHLVTVQDLKMQLLNAALVRSK